jgi:hypothetical protein
LNARLSDTPLVRLVARAASEPIVFDSGTIAERAVLGALLIDGKAIDRIGLGVADFASEEHRKIFQALRDAWEVGPVDLVAVGGRLADHGSPELVPLAAQFAQEAPSVQNLEHYAQLVRERAQRRQLAELGAELQQRAEREDLDELRRNLQTRLEARDNRKAWPTLDLASLAAQEPEPPRHIIPGWLPCGEVALLAGHGGAGKSQIALHLAVCVALGVEWHGLPVERRPVIYLSAEDRAEVLHWRLARISHHLRIPLAELAGRLEVIDASGLDAELLISSEDAPVTTPAYDALRERVRDPSVVLVLDGASDLYGASEIIRRHVRRFIRALRRLIGPDGAVLLLAHIDKAAARDGSTGDRYSGSTAWHNSVRARWSLSTAEGGSLVLALPKTQYGAPGAEIRLRWDEQAHLYVADQAPADGGMVASIRERAEVDAILRVLAQAEAAGDPIPAAAAGKRTAWHAIAAREGCPARLATPAGKDECWRLLERLRAEGRIRTAEARTRSRHRIEVLVCAPH